MKKNLLISLALGSAMFSGAALADNTVLVTHGADRSGSTVAALDLQSSGEATAIQFAIELPKGAKNIDTSGCLSSLPSTHIGMCKANAEKGRVAVMIYSTSNAPLPSGMVELGKVSFEARGKGEIALDRVVAGGAKGSLPVKARVESLDGPRGQRGSKEEQ